MFARLWAAGLALSLTVAPAARLERLNATGTLPAHLASALLEPLNYQETDQGQPFVFDRRGHAVFTLEGDAPKRVIQIGVEAGRILDPSAFDLDPRDGTFVIADSPGRRERIQTFTASGGQIGGFNLPGRALPRLTIGSAVLNGIGSLQFTGRTILVNQPERGALITEMAIDGTPIRTIGRLRPTGHEAESDVHMALNVGLPLVIPAGGYYFVFQSGVPVFRKYSADGQLMFERHIEGPEIDRYLKSMPERWPTHRTEDGDILPLVPPAVRTAGVDRAGRLWIALAHEPVVYVFDPEGDKIHRVQLHGVSGPLVASSLFFTRDGRVLTTPGCYQFRIPADW